MPSADPVSLSVVIPAYNEERRLPATLAALTAYLSAQPWSWEIRVVDNGSSDATRAIAEGFARSEPRIIVHDEPARGKGRAIKTGLWAARGELRFICDADLSMPVTELPRFLPPQAGDFDIAIGSREGAGARRVGEPLYRHLIGRVFNYCVQRLALPGIQDSQCGFKMFTRAAVSTVFPLVTVDDWAFDVEVLTIARAQGLRIVEVPIEWHYRPESKLSILRDGFSMLRQVLRIRLRAARGLYGRLRT